MVTAITDASIVIPTVGRSMILQRVLEHLARQTVGGFEVIVVCDGRDSDAGIDQLRAGNYPLRWLFHDERRGSAAARNTGARAAERGLLLFLDDDMMPEESWLQFHHQCHADPGADSRLVVLGHLTEQYLTPPESRIEAMHREHRQRGYARYFERCVEEGNSFAWSPHCGNNTSLTTEMFLSFGGFDPALEFGSDSELGSRMHAAGAQMMYEPRARAVHVNTRAAAEYDVRRPEIQGFNDVQAVRRNFDRGTRRGLLGGMTQGPHLRRVKERVAWESPQLVRRVARGLERVAEATRSERAFLGARGLVHSSAYWHGVRSAGEDRSSISELVGSPVPALLFHATPAVLAREENDLHLSSGRLEALLRILLRRGYRSMQPMEYRVGARHPRSVLLTFDDGYADTYENAFPLLQQFGFSATVFIVSGAIGGTSHWTGESGYVPRQLLSRSQIDEMQRHGVQFGSHSLTHAKLTTLDDAKLHSEIMGSKSMLEDVLGHEVTCFAYPSGRVDDRVRRVVAEAGYSVAFTTRDGLNSWGDPLLLNRSAISESDSTADFLMKIHTGRGVADEARHVIAPVVKGLTAIAPRPIRERVMNALRNAEAVRRRIDWERRVDSRRKA